MVRTATVDDARPISEVHARSWQTAYVGIVPGEYLDSLSHTLDRRMEWWQDRLAEGMTVHVAEHDGVIGFVNTGISEDGKHAELFAIYVDPDHWGHGHGHDLFLAAERHLATIDRDLAVLWVLEDNQRARSFYEAHGWKDSKRTALIKIAGADLTEVRYERPL